MWSLTPAAPFADSNNRCWMSIPSGHQSREAGEIASRNTTDITNHRYKIVARESESNPIPTRLSERSAAIVTSPQWFGARHRPEHRAARVPSTEGGKSFTYLHPTCVRIARKIKCILISVTDRRGDCRHTLAEGGRPFPAERRVYSGTMDQKRRDGNFNRMSNGEDG